MEDISENNKTTGKSSSLSSERKTRNKDIEDFSYLGLSNINTMKKLLLILLLLPVITFGQTQKLKETLIKKSIKWTQVASTGRNYEEAKKFLIPNIYSSTFSSNGTRLRIYDEKYFSSPVKYKWVSFETNNHTVQVSPNGYTAVVTFNVDGSYIFEENKIPYAVRASFVWTKVNGVWKKIHSHWSPRKGAVGIPTKDR